MFVAIIATRNSAITWLLGFPFDSLVMVHRWMGRWLLLCMTLHMGYFWAAWNDPTAGNLIVENTVPAAPLPLPLMSLHVLMCCTLDVCWCGAVQ